MSACCFWPRCSARCARCLPPHHGFPPGPPTAPALQPDALLAFRGQLLKLCGKKAQAAVRLPLLAAPPLVAWVAGGVRTVRAAW